MSSHTLTSSSSPIQIRQFHTIEKSYKMTNNSATTNTTKSIDVGSMFLMDLSVHESELGGGDLNDAVLLDNEHVFPRASTIHAPNKSTTTNSYKLNENKRSNYATQLLLTQNKAYHLRDYQTHQQQQSQENLGNSLDRLADAIYSDGKPKEIITTAKPQPPPEIVEHHRSSPSLSDESFITSSGSSSISCDGNSLSSSYAPTSDDAGDANDDDDVERGSTTTREDSGVLDMKDLDSQPNKSYDNDAKFYHHQDQRLKPKKPISNDITATNLINKSANNHINNTFNIKPTISNHNHHHHHHHHHNNNINHRGHQSSGREANIGKRSMSASLPIQVPARQMKKDLNKLKLGLIMDLGMETTAATNNQASITTTTIPSTSTVGNNYHHGDDEEHSSSNCAFRHDNHWAIADDFDEFLEQEYNDNHQNHYPIDKYDGEHLRADENPMKLFESIQALARSLHEDAELFGSLPPKRMLESPIRSLALA